MEHFGQSGAGQGPWYQVPVWTSGLAVVSARILARSEELPRQTMACLCLGMLQRCWFPFWAEEGKESTGVFISRRFLCAPK